MRTSHIFCLSLLVVILFTFSFASLTLAEAAKKQDNSDCESCECEDCDVNCVCVCSPCNCLCTTDSKAADANLGIELDTIVAFRNIQNMQLGQLVEVLRANSSVNIQVPSGKEKEKISFNVVGVKFEDVLKHLGLYYK